MAIAMPPAIKRRRALHAAHDELLSLQAAIVDTQAQIRDVQAKIVGTQAQIQSAQNVH
jgi:peptidoglycan hydrolase CwlO-like protein